VVDLLFGPTMHMEVLKRSVEILQIIAIEKRLTPQHIDKIWGATKVRLPLFPVRRPRSLRMISHVFHCTVFSTVKHSELFMFFV
jgi:hypothetical protein